jgi:UDP-N-acetylglucosamine 4,6-dehydratase/5-epimerase
MKILITGGTGSLGKALSRDFNKHTVISLSRDEFKQEMCKQDKSLSHVTYLLGDIRDRERLKMAFKGVDIVIHAAALKVIGKSYTDPEEFVKTNVLGTLNVINACIECGVKKAVFISTDKAVEPINLYGSTKQTAEKLWINANDYSNRYGKPVFCAVRYGNVIGSRGSVIPKFLQSIKEKGEIIITDRNCTRFVITLSQAVHIVKCAIYISSARAIIIPKLPAIEISDLVIALKKLNYKFKIKYIGLQKDEKMHEKLDNGKYSKDAERLTIPEICELVRSCENMG